MCHGISAVLLKAVRCFWLKVAPFIQSNLLRRGVMLFLLGLTVLFVVGGCAWQPLPAAVPAGDRPLLRIGVCPVENIEKTQDQLQPFIEYLEKSTGFKVALTVTSDYRSVINQMRQKEIDIAWFGPFSYVLAHKEAGAQAFAGTENPKSGKIYYSVFIVHPETGIENIQQLRGHRLAFTDPDSTSGYLIPKATLLKNGLNSEKDLLSVEFLGQHDAAVLAVKKHLVDAAAVSSIILQNMREKGLVGDKDYRIIYTSEAIPGSGAVWAYREGISVDALAKIREAFFSANHEETALGVFGKEIGTFFPVDDHDYDIIRETSQLLGMNAN